MRSGAEGSRTPDLLNAIQALSQLSYGPNVSDFDLHAPKGNRTPISTLKEWRPDR